MNKRTAADADFRAARVKHHPKRQRVESPIEARPKTAAPKPVEVTSGRQLQRLLVFEQGVATELRSGIQTFKVFLESILYPSADTELELPRRKAILREFLDSQRRRDHKDEEDVFLPNLVQAWTYAAETNFENLLSSVTAVLALLLRLCSRDADLHDYGTSLCKTILQAPQAKLLNRSLSHQKEYVISPVLGLLTEVLLYNEGALAKPVWWKRNFTLEPKIMASNLGMWKDHEDTIIGQKKPSVRSQAVRYLLSHLRLQDELGKSEILGDKYIIKNLFGFIGTDPSYLAIEILDVMRNHVFLDKTIPRRTKSFILAQRTLPRISELYKFHDRDAEEGKKTPAQVAHEFLLLVCTDPDMGVMLNSFGFYPPGSEKEDVDELMEDFTESFTEVGLDSMGKYDQNIPVRNVILAEFVQTLRPFANTLHQELLLAIFESSPELIADYFFKKATFDWEPKLTATWMGYSAFLYQTIQLPVPTFFGNRGSYNNLPPHPSIVMQNIFPQPLTQKAVTRCLNMNSDLITFFAIRVLIVAFQKLQSVLKEFENASRGRSRLWGLAAQQLIKDFCEKCPEMKTVINAFRTIPSEKLMQREAITRLLRMYYEITPQIALNEKIDISLPLCKALSQAESATALQEDKEMRVLELGHLLQIARHSPNMRWWQKHDSLQHSPFTTLVKLVAINSDSAESYAEIKSLLVSIVREHELLQMTTRPSALDALLASIKDSCRSNCNLVLEFLDECCSRFVKRPIKYQDDLDALGGSRSDKTDEEIMDQPLSALLMTFIEQWAHKGSKDPKQNSAEPIAHWLARLLFLLKRIGEDEELLSKTRDALVEKSHKAYQQILKDSFLWKMAKENAKDILRSSSSPESRRTSDVSSSPLVMNRPNNAEPLDLELPPEEDEKHTGLNRWKQKDLDESIEDGDVGELLLCLCSRHAEIRVQAVMGVKQLMAKLQATDNSDLTQLRLLLGETLETVRDLVGMQPLPYVAGVFAVHALRVLADPTHFMFPKINLFIQKAPSWEVDRLPTYFASKIIRSEPDEDSSYHKEVEWFLDYLIDCLRTPEDMEIFRSKNIFERMLGHYISPSCSIAAKEKTVRLLFRAAAVGGSTTLITRAGLLSWIQARIALKDHRHALLAPLASRLYETCDQTKVNEWSSGRAKMIVDLLRGTMA